MQALAERGNTVLVQISEDEGAGPFDQSTGVVVDRRRGTVSDPAFIQNILARGYWIPFAGDPEPVLSLAASALTAAGWDASKHPREPSGSEHGGEFVEIKGSTAHVRRINPETGEETRFARLATEAEKRDARKAAREAPHHLSKVGHGWYATEDGRWAVVGDEPGYAVTKGEADSEGLGAGLPTQREWAVVHSPTGGLREDHNGNNVMWVNTLKEGREQVRKRVEREQLQAAGFDESKHPRHPKGSDKGGEFAAKNSLVGTPSWLQSEAKTAEDAYYKATRPREAVATARGWLEENGYTEEAQGNAIQVVQAMEDHYPDGYEFFLSINDLHKEDFRRNYMRDGDYVPEREALHNGIRASYLSTARLPPAGEKPEALFLAGGSGAGKSSILGKQGEGGNFTGGTIDAPEGAVYINPDDIKELLPESDALKKIHDPRWASLSHEESSDIAARLRKDAEQAGFPMIVDGTGDAEGPSERFPEGKFMGKVRDAEKAGYKTKIVFVDIPTEEAIRRADIRAQQTGRKVSEQQIRDIHRSVTARHLEWRNTQEDWEVWANDDADAGGRRLIAKRVAGGPIEILDADRYAQMEAKA